MFDIGGGELLVILLAILLLFGPKHLPELSRTLGKGWRQLQKAQEELREQLRELSAEIAHPTVPPPKRKLREREQQRSVFPPHDGQ
ncbi:MAG: twin-arginine translocase TatA/TatE family subunit [Chlorobiota bacterium]